MQCTERWCIVQQSTGFHPLSVRSTSALCCCSATQPFFVPSVGRLRAPSWPHPAGSTGQTVSVIPKISYRFSATIPPLLFVAFKVRFQRLGWPRGGWAVTWPEPPPASSTQTINRLPTDCPIQIHQPSQLPNQQMHAACCLVLFL